MKTKNFFAETAAWLLIVLTLLVWVFEPALPTKACTYLVWVVYALLLMAIYLTPLDKPRIRSIFLAFAMIMPLVEIIWLAIYQSPMSNYSSFMHFMTFNYWGSYLAYILILPIAAARIGMVHYHSRSRRVAS